MNTLCRAAIRAVVTATTVASIFVAHFAALPAFGCSYHNVIPDAQLDGIYPGSLSVAVALRKAAENGVIDTNALEASTKGIAVYADAQRRLLDFGKILAASPASAELPSSFTLGYVESSLWTRFSQSDGKLHIDDHTAGPTNGEAVLLTGEPVLTEVLSGSLSVDRALAEGLILIDGNESEKAAMRQVLNVTSTIIRISRQKPATALSTHRNTEIQQ